MQFWCRFVLKLNQIVFFPGIIIWRILVRSAEHEEENERTIWCNILLYDKFVGISQNIQEMLQNAENIREIVKIYKT